MITFVSRLNFLYKALMKKLLLSLSFILIMSSTSQAQSPSYVQNSGIVILNGYMRMFMDRLNLLDGEKFRTLESQHRCVYLNNYLATGVWGAPDHELDLSKVMCGLDTSDEVVVSDPLTEAEKTLAESLIKAAISHWPSIGASSVDGFRGNWMVRNGGLQESQERWDLVVERRAYDVLLSRSPFSFSIIKYPWMAKPIQVTWPQ